MYRRTVLLFLLLSTLWIAAGSAWAAPEPPSKRIIALAVHIENPKRDWPGLSSLNDKIIETIINKISSMLVDEILSGTGVMDKLNEFGIDNLDSADPNRLTAYGRQNNISYIILFNLRTADLSYSLKAFDVAKASFLYDGAQTPPPEPDSGWSFSDLSPTHFFMKRVVPSLDAQLTAMLKLMS